MRPAHGRFAHGRPPRGAAFTAEPGGESPISRALPRLFDAGPMRPVSWALSHETGLMGAVSWAPPFRGILNLSDSLIGELHEQDIGSHGFSPDLCTLARPNSIAFYSITSRRGRAAPAARLRPR